MNNSEPPEEAITKKRAPLWWRLLGVFVRTGVVLVVAGMTYLIWANRPNSGRHSRVIRAVMEIKGVELCVYKICTDAGVSSPRSLFDDTETHNYESFQDTLNRHTQWMYWVIRKGKFAEAPLKPDVRRKLGESYMDLGKDPWGRRYVFYMPSEEPVSGFNSIFEKTYIQPDEVSSNRSFLKEHLFAVVSAGKDGRLELTVEVPDFEDGKNNIDDIRDDITNLCPDDELAAYNLS